MFIFKNKNRAAAVAMLLAAGASQGATIDFDSYVAPITNPYFFWDTPPLAVDGYLFSTERSPTSHFHLVNNTGACAADSCVSNGTQYLGLNMANLTMVKAGGGAFSVSAIDATNAYKYSHPALTLVVQGNQVGGGTVTQTFTLAQNSFTPFSLTGFTNLSSLVFRAGDANGTVGNYWFALDNIHVADFPAAPVPEPETYAMLLAGLGILAMLARRR